MAQKIANKNKELLKKMKCEICGSNKTLHMHHPNYEKPKTNIIAVTVAQGLEPALWVGVNFARALSFSWEIPVIPIHHIEAHIFANFLNQKFNTKDKTIFPVICLSVSGGHTQLILIKDY